MSDLPQQPESYEQLLPEQLAPKAVPPVDPIARARSIRRMRFAAMACLVCVILAAIAMSTVPAKRDKAGLSANEFHDLPVKAEIDGKLATLTVKEGDVVQAGQIIATIDEKDYLQAVKTAQDNYNQSFNAAADPGIAVALPGPVGNGMPSGTIVQSAPFKPPRTEPEKTTDRLPNVGGAATPGLPTPKSGADAAQSVLDSLIRLNAQTTEELTKAQDLVTATQDSLAQAKAEVGPLQKSVDVAQSIADKAQKDADRMQNLLAQGAVAARDVTRQQAFASTSQGALANAKKSLDAGNAAIADKQAELQSAQDRVAKANEILKTLPSKIDQAKAKVALARKAAPPSMGETLPSPTGGGPVSHKPASVHLKGPVSAAPPVLTGPVTPAPVHVDFGAPEKAKETIAKSLDALNKAQKNLDATKLRAPKAGKIVKILVAPGQGVYSGEAIMVIRPL